MDHDFLVFSIQLHFGDEPGFAQAEDLRMKFGVSYSSKDIKRLVDGAQQN